MHSPSRNTDLLPISSAEQLTGLASYRTSVGITSGVCISGGAEAELSGERSGTDRDGVAPSVGGVREVFVSSLGDVGDMVVLTVWVAGREVAP